MRKKFQYLLYALILSLLFHPSCSEEKKDNSNNRSIKRIVSLSPSITKQVIDLDSEGYLVGVTSYHPALKRRVDIVGTLINPNLEKIMIVKPDIVFFSEEESIAEKIERLAASGIKTYIFKKNRNFRSICNNYLTLAGILGKEKLAKERIRKFRKSLLKTRKINRKRKIAFFVSHKPLMTASGNSYIGGILKDTGSVNVFNHLKQPYSIVSFEMLAYYNPDVIISIMPDAEQFFLNILKDFSNVKALKNRRIYYISPDIIAFYTPADYVKSVELLCGMLNKERQVKVK